MDRALRALSRAEVVVMVVDGSEGVTQQVGGAWASGFCLCLMNAAFVALALSISMYIAAVIHTALHQEAFRLQACMSDSSLHACHSAACHRHGAVCKLVT